MPEASGGTSKEDSNETNLLERLFEENRRRVKVIPHFFAEKAGMKLVYATLLATANLSACDAQAGKWRGVRMDVFIQKQIDEVWQAIFEKSRKDIWAA
jgi:transposase-like protein